MNENNTKLSERISDLCGELDQAQMDYQYYYDKVNEMDRLTQDYLHMVELKDLYDMELVRFGEELRDCQRKRREYKDICDHLQPVVEFLKTEKGQTTHDQLKQLLGKVRETEKRLANRQYIPRTLKEEEWGWKNISL